MLSSNSVTPPETTTRNTITRKEPQTTTTTKSNLPAFEDNPGDLPDDAIKSDDEVNDINGGKSQQDQKVAILPEISKDSIVDNGGDAIITNKQESSAEDLHGKESTEEQEKQKESENQNTEESSFTQNQRIEEITSEESKQTSNNNENNEQNRVSEENNVENQKPNDVKSKAWTARRSAYPFEIFSNGVHPRATTVGNTLFWVSLVWDSFENLDGCCVHAYRMDDGSDSGDVYFKGSFDIDRMVELDNGVTAKYPPGGLHHLGDHKFCFLLTTLNYEHGKASSYVNCLILDISPTCDEDGEGHNKLNISILSNRKFFAVTVIP